MVLLASILYIVFIAWMAFTSATVRLNGQPVRSVSGRVIIAIFVWPFVGIMFWLMGFVGKFLLLPFIALFN